MLSQTEAQAYLAERLRERIGAGLSDDDDLPVGTNLWMFWWKNPDGSEDYIRETEWLFIAHEVEGKINSHDRLKYLTALCGFIPRQESVEVLTLLNGWLICNATYTQRATAMKESGMKV